MLLLHSDLFLPRVSQTIQNRSPKQTPQVRGKKTNKQTNKKPIRDDFMLPKEQSLGSSEYSAFHSPTGTRGVGSRLVLAGAGCKEKVNQKGQLRGLEEHDKQLLRGHSPGGRNEEGK